jgi:hypothetical protein
MDIQRVIRRRLRYDEDGVQVAGDVHVAIAANVGRSGDRTSVTSTHADDAPEKRDDPGPTDGSSVTGAGDGPARSDEEGGRTDG